MNRSAEIKTNVAPEVRRTLERIAARERRTLSAMVELLLIEGIAARIAVPEQQPAAAVA